MFRCDNPVRLALMAVAFASLSFPNRFVAAAENDDAEAATVERYTGPPILLDEPETPPPAALVDKQVNKDQFANGKTRFEREIARYSDDRFEADGFYHEFYPSGAKFVEGQFKKGNKDGTWTYYLENGTVQRTVNYKNGQPDGGWEVHNADGAVVARRSFKDGKRDGTWAIYDEAGKQQLREEVYADGKPEGVWKVWYPSGQLMTEATLKAGTRDGVSRQWNEKGSLQAEVNFAKGKLDGTATVWTAQGKKVVQHFQDGKPLKDDSQK
ncbi:MAG: toxin-antitoxin system YwqK family antitoxin [Pirellulales bacterium]